MSIYARISWIVLALAVLLSAFALRMHVDNRVERWVHPSDLERARYADFRQTFGSDEFILMAYTGRPIFDTAALDAQVAAAEAVEAIPGVLRVDGVPILFRDQFGREDAEALAAEFTDTPFYRRFLIDDAGSVAALLVEITPPPTAAGRRDLVQSLEAAAQPLRDFGYEVHMAGPPLLNAVLDDASRREAARSFPPALGLSMGLLLFLLRPWRAALAAAACATLAVTATLGAMGLAGQPMTMVTSALPALLWVLALAACVHVINRYQAHRGSGLPHETSVRCALRDVTRPSILAGATTIAGFLSLAFADLAPVRGLGLFASLGVAIAFVLALMVCPLFLRLLRVGSAPGGPQSSVSPWLARISMFARRRRISILIAGAALCAACAAWIPGLAIESNPLTFLPRESPTVRDYAFIGERLTGFYSLELVVELGANWTDPGQWPAIESVAAQVAAQPGVVRVLSPLDVLRKIRQWENGLDAEAYKLPEDAAEARALADGLDDDSRKVLGRFVDSSGRKLRLSVLINEMNSTVFTSIVACAEVALARLTRPAHGYATGVVLQLVDSQLALVRTQVRSFASAFLVIFLCIGIGLRSARLALLAIPPNVLPIFAVLAVMAACGVPLDAGTVMVAGVALGIAVDDTLHLLATIQRARRAGASPEEAVTDALYHSGRALVFTSIIACAGFAILFRSEFVPIAWFGLLTAAALATASATELFLTPALYLSFARSGHARDASKEVKGR